MKMQHNVLNGVYFFLSGVGNHFYHTRSIGVLVIKVLSTEDKKKNNIMKIFSSERFLLVEKVAIWGDDISNVVNIVSFNYFIMKLLQEMPVLMSKIAESDACIGNE